MNKNIIIAIVVVIIIAVAGFMVFGQNIGGKMDTQIKFTSNSTLQNGEQVQFELKDVKGNALSGQKVNITFNNKEKYSISTDKNGKGYLTISGEDAGSYEVKVDYAGNDKYKPCSAKTNITITDDEADEPAQETDVNASANSGTNGSSNDGLHYDSKYGVYYDDDGVIHAPGTQFDGMNIDDYRQWQDDPEGFIKRIENITDDSNNTTDDSGASSDDSGSSSDDSGSSSDDSDYSSDDSDNSTDN